MGAPSLRGLEDERVGDDNDTATFWFGELESHEPTVDASLDRLVVQR